MPADYYRVPGVPYPAMPRQPRPPVDPNDLLRDTTMDADAGMGAQPPRDPYMANLPPRPQAQAAPAVTTLSPGRTTPFSRADAQALAALDPRALEQAKALAAMPESTPAKITGSFGGKNFEMQPAARVDRNALARLYAGMQQKQGQERQDAVRGQEQSGRERLVTIPGEQLTNRRKMELESEERITGKKLEGEAPERAARIAQTQAQTAAVSGAETRAQAQAARQQTPQQEAIDTALAEAQASPFAQTPEGRARIAALAKQSTVGKVVPDSAATAGGPAPDPIAALESDEGVQKIIADAKSKSSWSLNPATGFGADVRASRAAARNLAQSAIRRAAAKYGMAPEEIQQYIQSKLGG